MHNFASLPKTHISIIEENYRQVFDNVWPDSQQIIVSYRRDRESRETIEDRERKRERGGGERERESYPRISQPATPQMKHTWVVLDLARIIPHPRLSSTHRANTATHVEQTHTRDYVYTVNEEIYGCTSVVARNLRTPRSLAKKKRSHPLGKIILAVCAFAWYLIFYVTRIF